MDVIEKTIFKTMVKVEISPEDGHLERASATQKEIVLAQKLRKMLELRLEPIPWKIHIRDWLGNDYKVGGDETHWAGEDMHVTVKTPAAGRTLLAYDPMRFLEKFLANEVDLDGNLFLMSDIRHYGNFNMKAWQVLPNIIMTRMFQTMSRAKVSVKSHYDIPQEALNVYLDQKYMSYSCGMYENPGNLNRKEMLRVGKGEADDFDSMEKSMWRKFKDAIDYIAPGPDDEILDVGCGYAGQLAVALESHNFRKIVGWTHSSNQVREGKKMLAPFPENRWELHEGDYREDERIFDHITSTGMISHVGPRGLMPYVRNVRKRIKTGGRYLHHSLMKAYSNEVYESNTGMMFNKKYVWPGFHWFTIGEHIKTLEENGFEIQRITNLSRHYAKTTASWYERMVDQEVVMIENLGKST